MTTHQPHRVVGSDANGIRVAPREAHEQHETPPSRWDFAPAPESVKVAIAPRHGLFIDGQFRPPRSGRHFATINPATEQTLSEIADAGDADVALAVAAARKAQPRWARLRPSWRWCPTWPSPDWTGPAQQEIR